MQQMVSLHKGIDLPEKLLKYRSNNQIKMKPYCSKMINIRQEIIWSQQFSMISKFITLISLIRNRMTLKVVKIRQVFWNCNSVKGQNDHNIAKKIIKTSLIHSMKKGICWVPIEWNQNNQGVIFQIKKYQ
jgi:hypothetical protein